MILMTNLLVYHKVCIGCLPLQCDSQRPWQADKGDDPVYSFPEVPRYRRVSDADRVRYFGSCIQNETYQLSDKLPALSQDQTGSFLRSCLLIHLPSEMFPALLWSHQQPHCCRRRLSFATDSQPLSMSSQKRNTSPHWPSEINVCTEPVELDHRLGPVLYLHNRKSLSSFDQCWPVHTATIVSVVSALRPMTVDSHKL